KLAAQPIKEEALLTGALEPTNEPYAIAKIAGIKLCQAYARQHGANFISAMPTNLYGPGDNFDLQTSHVLPALIRKVHEAKMQNRREVVIGCGYDITIRELALLVAKVVGIDAKLVFDTSKPDGTPRKLLDTSRLRQLGWQPRITLENGV